MCTGTVVRDIRSVPVEAPASGTALYVIKLEEKFKFVDVYFDRENSRKYFRRSFFVHRYGER